MIIVRRAKASVMAGSLSRPCIVQRTVRSHLDVQRARKNGWPQQQGGHDEPEEREASVR